MRLYHTGYEEIREPDIHHGRKNADFGQGFYMTANEEFACRWARERAGRPDPLAEADVIVGPIANDTIFDTFGIITSGFLSAEQAIKLLLIGPQYEQIVEKVQKEYQTLFAQTVEQISVIY